MMDTKLEAKLLIASHLLLGAAEGITPAKEDIKLSPDVSHIDTELKNLTDSLVGDKVLVLLPTGNEQKATIMKAMFPGNGSEMKFENLKGISSGAGEQPYNSAGALGTVNRILGSLASFVSGTTHLGPAEIYCRTNDIGKIMVASIENYIAGTNAQVGHLVLEDAPMQSSTHTHDQDNSQGYDTLENAIDYGIVALYDLATRQTLTASSRGVRVPVCKNEQGKVIDFVALAMSKGFENGHRDHGNQTVGKVIQSLVEPSQGTRNSIDGRPYKINANWHADVIGTPGMDRYSLLFEAAASILQQGMEKDIYSVKGNGDKDAGD